MQACPSDSCAQTRSSQSVAGQAADNHQTGQNMAYTVPDGAFAQCERVCQNAVSGQK